MIKDNILKVVNGKNNYYLKLNYYLITIRGLKHEYHCGFNL